MTRGVLMALVLACVAAHAQSIVKASRLPALMRDFDDRPYEQTLDCSVTPIKPSLNFSFRFQAGYSVRVPMNQYFGPHHRWAVVMRVQPEHGGDPAYLAANYRLPDIPKTNMELEVGGGFLLGPGAYHVVWKLVDDHGRVCRSAWNAEAKLTRGEKKLRLTIPPGTVAEFSGRGLPPANTGPDDAPPFRLTVMLHAAPASPRRTRLSGRDRFTLLGTLSALLERLPARSVRLVVFNLDQQRELYRQDQFQLDNLDQVAQSIDQLELGLVDVHVLQNRRGHIDLLANLVNREATDPNPSDVVVFLGPASRFMEKPSSSALERPPGLSQHLFFLEYRPPFLRMQSSVPDSIASAVGRMKGKRLVIGTPGEFAKAIEQVERREK
jgi:hypothetical protein